MKRTQSPALRNGELQKDSTPGIGVAGQVLCPIMSLTHPALCVKHACEFWVELTYNAGKADERKVGRCAIAWNALLATEQTQAVNALNQTIKAKS